MRDVLCRTGRDRALPRCPLVRIRGTALPVFRYGRRVTGGGAPPGERVHGTTGHGRGGEADQEAQR